MNKQAQRGSPVKTIQRYRQLQDGPRVTLKPADEDGDAGSNHVGMRLRAMRMERGFSIRSLAERSGLNFNTLSLIENEKSSPSVSTLQQLAQALQVPITAFFETIALPKEVVHQKKGERPRSVFSHGVFEDLGTGLRLGKGMPLLLTMEPGADSGQEMTVHTGQEFVYCLDGVMTYTVAGKTYELHSGDSLIFEARLPHCWGNRGTRSSHSILILCPADDHDQPAEQHFKNDGREEQAE